MISGIHLATALSVMLHMNEDEMSDVTLNFELLPSHTQMDRAHMLARLALAEFANDRNGMTERAAFRIADALEKYSILDLRERAKEPVAGPNPLTVNE